MKQPLNCLIVDDEILAQQLLETFLKRIPYLNLVGKCGNAVEASSLLHDNPADMLFLDIQMPEITGLDFLKSLTVRPNVVLTTAFPNFALDGFNLNVVDYLLKPIAFDRFLNAVLKVEERLSTQGVRPQRVEATEPPDDYIFLKQTHRLIKVFLRQIIYAESIRDYVKIVTADGPLESYITLKLIEESLLAPDFIRVHRSFIVRADAVRSIEGNTIHTVGPHEIPIGPQYRDDVLKQLIGNKLVTR